MCSLHTGLGQVILEEVDRVKQVLDVDVVPAILEDWLLRNALVDSLL